jgi:hypothetical protein
MSDYSRNPGVGRNLYHKKLGLVMTGWSIRDQQKTENKFGHENIPSGRVPECVALAVLLVAQALLVWSMSPGWML